MYSQSNDVKLLLQPENSQGILAWQNSTSTVVDRWRIDIMKGEMVNGVLTMVPQIQYFQNKEYLGLDAQYRTSDYYYHIYGVDAFGNIVLDDGGPAPIAVGTHVVILCSQECIGNNYAYKISQNVLVNNNDPNNPIGYYLSADGAPAWNDPVTNVSSPYFHYVSANSWDNSVAAETNIWVNDIYPYKTIRFQLSSIPGVNFVKDAFGSGLTGTIVGIEKTMGNLAESPRNGYEIYSGVNTVMLASQLGCSSQLSSFSSTFDLYNALNFPNTNSSLPTLSCTPDPNNFLMSVNGTLFTEDPTAHSGNDYITFDFWQLNDSSDWHPCFPEPCPPSTGGIIIKPIEAISAAIQYRTNSVNNYSLSSSDFIQFEFQKIGDPTYSLILKPEDIIQEDGSLSLLDYSFSPGLYKLNIFYSNNILYPVYFESVTSSGAGVVGLSSYLTTTIYPVPIVNNEFSLNFTSSKDLSFRYDMYDLNGELLSTEHFEIRDGEEIIFHTSIDPSIILPSNMLVNTFTFEDGSYFSIQTIKSINN